MEDWEKLAVKDKVTLAKWLFQPRVRRWCLKRKKLQPKRQKSFAQTYGELINRKRDFFKRNFGEYIDTLLHLVEKGNLIKRQHIKRLYKMSLKWEKNTFNFACLICKTLCKVIADDYEQNQKFFLRFHDRNTVKSTCEDMKKDEEKFLQIIQKSVGSSSFTS